MAADRNGMDDGVDSGPMIKVARAGGGGSVGGRNSKFFGWVLHLFLRAACGVATNVLVVWKLYTSNTQETTAQQFLKKHVEANERVDRDKAAVLSTLERDIAALRLPNKKDAETIERCERDEVAIALGAAKGRPAGPQGEVRRRNRARRTRPG